LFKQHKIYFSDCTNGLSDVTCDTDFYKTCPDGNIVTLHCSPSVTDDKCVRDMGERLELFDMWF